MKLSSAYGVFAGGNALRNDALPKSENVTLSKPTVVPSRLF